MNSEVTTACGAKLGTDANEIEFEFFHKLKRRNVVREIEEWVGDGDFDPYTVDDGKYTVIGVTDAGDLILVSNGNGAVSVFTDIDCVQSDVCESVSQFIDSLAIEPI